MARVKYLDYEKCLERAGKLDYLEQLNEIINSLYNRRLVEDRKKLQKNLYLRKKKIKINAGTKK